jgi:hypothetical protein
MRPAQLNCVIFFKQEKVIQLVNKCLADMEPERPMGMGVKAGGAES